MGTDLAPCSIVAAPREVAASRPRSTSVARDAFHRRPILGALVAGDRDPAVLAHLSVRQLLAEIPALRQALVGRFTGHHAFLVDLHCHLD